MQITKRTQDQCALRALWALRATSGAHQRAPMDLLRQRLGQRLPAPRALSGRRPPDLGHRQRRGRHRSRARLLAGLGEHRHHRRAAHRARSAPACLEAPPCTPSPPSSMPYPPHRPQDRRHAHRRPQLRGLGMGSALTSSSPHRRRAPRQRDTVALGVASLRLTLAMPTLAATSPIGPYDAGAGAFVAPGYRTT